MHAVMHPIALSPLDVFTHAVTLSLIITTDVSAEDERVGWPATIGRNGQQLVQTIPILSAQQYLPIGINHEGKNLLDG